MIKPLFIALILIASLTASGQKPITVPRSPTTTTTTKAKSKSASPAAKKSKSRATKGSINGHEWVDLGLPSGLKWATMNVGAASPTDPGSLFAWGEVNTKASFSDNTSRLSYQNVDCISKRPDMDAARAQWGGTWEMPMLADVQELIKHCSTEPITLRGGSLAAKFTGPNGNYIILPACTDNTAGTSALTLGLYWTSTPETEHYTKHTHAFILGFQSGGRYWQSENRGRGCAIRPVSE